MRFILRNGAVSCVVGTCYISPCVARADTGVEYEIFLPQFVFFGLGTSVLMMSVTAILAFILGVFAKRLRYSSLCLDNLTAHKSCISLRSTKQCKSVCHNAPNNITPRCVLDSLIEDHSRHKVSLSHYYISKSWVCLPTNIIAEQLSWLADKPVTINFSNHIDDVNNTNISVCPIWFSKAIHELLSNALKHNGNKSNLTLFINTFIEDKVFTVSVSDNGAGISDTITNALSSAANAISQCPQTVYAQLYGPINLLSMQSLLRKVGGSLKVTSARQFLTKITLKLPILDKPTATNISTKAGEIDQDEILQAPNSASSISCASTPLSQAKKNDAPTNCSSDSQISLQVEDCISTYNTYAAPSKDVGDLASSRFIKKFNRLLLDHYCEESFNKPQAANIMLMTDKTLTRRLHRHYHLGFVETLRKFRLHKATNLLLNGDSVTNVALDTGFSSPSYFAQCFKLEFGFAPSMLLKYMTVQGAS